MSDEKFTYPCDLEGNSGTQKFNVLSTKFGDGYEQNVSVGINNRKGETNLANSTLLKKLNAKDYKGAAAEFLRWNKAGGKVLNGLVKRRNAEMELFLK